MNKGFYLQKLVLKGSNKKDSYLEFEKGFNLIAGVSDTGKSYAFSCIGFMLGTGDNPKPIPESKGYTNYYLQICTFEEVCYTILRIINSDEVIIKECAVDKFDITKEYKTVKANHPSKTLESLSMFYLELIGLKGKELKKSKAEKRRIAMSDIRKLTTISEERIITEKSPIYASGQYADQPFYQSLLRYLLTGNDDKEFVKMDNKKDKKTHLTGQIEFIKMEKQNIKDELEKKQKEKQKYGESKNSIDFIEGIEKSLEDKVIKYERINTEINGIQDSIVAIESSLIFKNELKNRFNLLIKHYKNDIQRLEFIIEGKDLTSQLATVNCPVCDNEIKGDEVKNDRGFKISVQAEYEKISLKLIDIQDTINSLNKEIHNLSIERNRLDKETDKQKELKKELVAIIGELKSKIKEGNNIQRIDNNLDVYTQRLQYLINQELSLNKELSNFERSADKRDVDEFENINEYCKIMSIIFKNIAYPGWESITFDTNYKIFDIVISGKDRRSFGKGYRSISYSVVLISLVEWIIKKEIAFNPLLILDSPLTTYHGRNALREKDDEVKEDIQDLFFKYLSTIKNDRQIIMFDNKVPTHDIQQKIKFTYFTGDKTGSRKGFIAD